MPRPYRANQIFPRLAQIAVYNFSRRGFMPAITNKHRRSIRLKDYDYSQMGAYFVTICTHKRECLFGEIHQDAMVLNELGKIAHTNWMATPDHFAHVELDAFVVMPNHVHGILLFQFERDLQKPNSPTPLKKESCLVGAETGSLGAVVGSYKASVTKRVNLILNQQAQVIWQRNYFERVIRNKQELLAIRTYIQNNPLKWQLDADYFEPKAQSG